MDATLSRRAVCCLAALVMLLPGAGCSLMPGAKLAACRAEKEQLLARIQQDQDRLAAAEARERTAIQRLAQAEKSLALLHDGRLDIERLASRPVEAARQSDAPIAPADQNGAGDSGWEPRQP
ncbi:MAG: hypothetical protein RIC55_28580 [Pirellulaceae bacterium]